jgi:hypothetical protein
MENASKALIIAGAILVSIVIITLGVMIVSNVRDTIQQNSNLSEQEISTYNSPFEAYLGTQSGTQVKALCDLIRNHNLANTDDETKNIKIVTGENPGNEAALTSAVSATTVNTFKEGIKAGKTYTVAFSYDKNSGLIVGAYVNEKN